MNKSFFDSNAFAYLFWGSFIFFIIIGHYWISIMMLGFFIGLVFSGRA